MEPTYHLEGVIQTKEEMADFEGPLNLILMLLSKNKIEIRDINISDIRPVMYVENADQIAEFVKNNMEAALSTNFVIKTEENNCSNIYFEANEKISAATERYVYSSYYFSNGYMMYMIEML